MTATAVATALPNFLVIGAMRAGSTSLHAALSGHPEIYMTKPKELHFFVAERNWPRGLEWYTRHFTPGANHLARGEASVTYSQFPQFRGVAERAASVVPDARIVYLVRDPLARMRSQYEHDLRRALAGNPPFGWSKIAACGGAAGAFLQQEKYLDASRYASQLDQWTAVYPADRVLVLASEWLWQQPATAFREIAGFLGVDSGWQPEEAPALNASDRPRRRPVFASVPGINRVGRMLPDSVKSRLRPTAPSDPAGLDELLAVPDEITARLHEQLRDEVRRLRPHVTGEFTGWGIA
jgi:hypothetical protein